MLGCECWDGLCWCSLRRSSGQSDRLFISLHPNPLPRTALLPSFQSEAEHSRAAEAQNHVEGTVADDISFHPLSYLTALCLCCGAVSILPFVCCGVRDKTGNAWSEREDFQFRVGKYTYLGRDYSAEDESEEKKTKAIAPSSPPKSVKPPPECSLDSSVASLVSLICDVAMMQRSMVEIGYDAQKLPLGKLSKEHIAKGYAVLKELADVLNGPAPSRSALTELSNRFYSLIPHVWGRRVPEVIGSVDRLKAKLELVEALGDIEVAMKLLHKGGGDDEDEVHPIDRHYQQLKCHISPIDRNGETMQLIKVGTPYSHAPPPFHTTLTPSLLPRCISSFTHSVWCPPLLRCPAVPLRLFVWQSYVKLTHGSTHTGFGLEVEEAFELDRQGEKERFHSHHATPNRMLLWHGSRLSNFTGILSQGLRIAPPEAPVSGYMFGKVDVTPPLFSSPRAHSCPLPVSAVTDLIVPCDCALCRASTSPT